MKLVAHRLSASSGRNWVWIAAAVVTFVVCAEDDATRVVQVPGNGTDDQSYGASPDQPSKGEKAPAVTLEDQFKKSTTIDYPSESITVIVLADREGSKQVEPWVRKLYDRFGDRIAIRGIALLKGVPAALRSTVRFMFRKQVSYPVLMDWDGEVTSQFPFKPGVASVVVVDTSGRIVATEYGAANQDVIERVQKAVDRAMNGIEQKDK